MGSLTPEQREAYWRDGFVVVRGLFAPDELTPWIERTRALASGAVPPPPSMKLVRDVMVAKRVVAPRTPEHAICKINFFENDPAYMTYATDPRLLDCVESIVGPEILFVNSMVITKPPGVDAAAERVHVEMAPGDTLLFHSLLIHGSGTNRTEGFRRAISVHYARADAHDEWDGKDPLANRPWIPVRGRALAG